MLAEAHPTPSPWTPSPKGSLTALFRFRTTHVFVAEKCVRGKFRVLGRRSTTSPKLNEIIESESTKKQQKEQKPVRHVRRLIRVKTNHRRRRYEVACLPRGEVVLFRFFWFCLIFVLVWVLIRFRSTSAIAELQKTRHGSISQSCHPPFDVSN